MASRKRGAVVTGAAGGIGRAVAERLLAEGVGVLAVDVDEKRLQDVAALGCDVLVADLSDEKQRAKLATVAAGLDYLVNAAGVLRVKPILEVTVEDWRAIQAVNVESVFFLCQQIGARLNAGGAIVNLSSSSAKLASSTDVAPYAASKSTILSITRSFAYAFAERRVRVNAVCPGIIETRMQAHFLEGVARLRGTTPERLDSERKKAVPLGRAGSAAECAGLIWYLLSDEAAYMTGQAINLTGGLVTW
jgi:NAD(P)-dependent dehydrogenase (short-subunit alcohol dehydrogenase family)